MSHSFKELLVDFENVSHTLKRI